MNKKIKHAHLDKLIVPSEDLTSKMVETNAEGITTEFTTQSIKPDVGPSRSQKQRQQKRLRNQQEQKDRQALLAYQAKIKRFHKEFFALDKQFDPKLSAKRLFQCFIQGDVDAVCKSYAERLSKLRGILRQLKTIAYSCFGAENQKDFDRFMSNLRKSLTANAESLGMLPENRLLLENLLDLICSQITQRFLDYPGFLTIAYSKRNIFATLADIQGKFFGVTTTGYLKRGRGKKRNIIINVKQTGFNTVKMILTSELTPLALSQKGQASSKKINVFKKIILKAPSQILKSSKRLKFKEIFEPAVREHNGSRSVKVRRR